MKIFIILVLFLNTHLLRAEDECLAWFKEGQVSPIAENCLITCASLATDMGTFHCPNECEYLCKLSTKEKLLFKYAYYPALTPAERALIAMYPKRAFVVFKQKNLAEKRTDLYFPKGLVDDESDAFRHFLWASLIYKELGKDLAQKFLDAHENNEYQTEATKGMDLANNRAGLLEADRLEKDNKLTLKEIEKSALKNLREQKLVILKKRLKIPKEIK